MKNKISLAFGLAMIIVGVLSLWMRVDYMVILGITLSSFLFIVIHSCKSKGSLLNILPITLLLCFCIFPQTLGKLPVFKGFLSDNVNSFLLFITLGFIFIFSFYLESQRQRENNTVEELKAKEEGHLTMLLSNHVLRQLTTVKADGNYVLTILTSMIKKFDGKEKVSYNDVKEEIEELQAFLENKSFLNDIKYSLLKNDRENVQILDSLELIYREHTPIIEKEKVAKMQEELMGTEEKEKEEEI